MSLILHKASSDTTFFVLDIMTCGGLYNINVKLVL